MHFFVQFLKFFWYQFFIDINFLISIFLYFKKMIAKNWQQKIDTKNILSIFFCQKNILLSIFSKKKNIQLSIFYYQFFFYCQFFFVRKIYIYQFFQNKRYISINFLCFMDKTSWRFFIFPHLSTGNGDMWRIIRYWYFNILNVKFCAQVGKDDIE